MYSQLRSATRGPRSREARRDKGQWRVVFRRKAGWQASPPAKLALRIPHSERDETPISLED
jgi:hypothetical protein